MVKNADGVEIDSHASTPHEDTRYLVDNENLTGYSQTLAELDGSGQVRRLYTYGDDLRSQEDVSATQSVHTAIQSDALGSVGA